MHQTHTNSMWANRHQFEPLCVEISATLTADLDSDADIGIGVSCCALDGSDCWRDKFGSCQTGDFATASAICADNGRRLCTVAELESNLCYATGCDADNRRNWSLDSCTCTTPTPTLAPTPPHYFVEKGESSFSNSLPLCLEMSETADPDGGSFGASCCALDGTYLSG